MFVQRCFCLCRSRAEHACAQAAEAAIKAAERQVCVCANVECSSSCDMDAANDWQGCSECPKARILWFCPKTKCTAMLKQHERNSEARQAQLHVENAGQKK